jgi:hypothetical protein
MPAPGIVRVVRIRLSAKSRFGRLDHSASSRRNEIALSSPLLLAACASPATGCPRHSGDARGRRRCRPTAAPPGHCDGSGDRDGGREPDTAPSPRRPTRRGSRPSGASGADAAARTPARADGAARAAADQHRLPHEGGELIFPASASLSMDHSPPFAWSGAPATRQSFALTFVDESNGPPSGCLGHPRDASPLPGNLSKTVHPTELPEASQRGSLGRTGYSGRVCLDRPCTCTSSCSGRWTCRTCRTPAVSPTAGPAHEALPMHVIAKSPPLVAKGQEGGP